MFSPLEIIHLIHYHAVLICILVPFPRPPTYLLIDKTIFSLKLLIVLYKLISPWNNSAVAQFHSFVSTTMQLVLSAGNAISFNQAELNKISEYCCSSHAAVKKLKMWSSHQCTSLQFSWLVVKYYIFFATFNWKLNGNVAHIVKRWEIRRHLK